MPGMSRRRRRCRAFGDISIGGRCHRRKICENLSNLPEYTERDAGGALTEMSVHIAECRICGQLTVVIQINYPPAVLVLAEEVFSSS